MSDLREPVRPATVDDEATFDEIAETMRLLNEAVKEMSRCGKTKTLTAEYAERHARLNAFLDELEAKRGFATNA